MNAEIERLKALIAGQAETEEQQHLRAQEPDDYDVYTLGYDETRTEEHKAQERMVSREAAAKAKDYDVYTLGYDETRTEEHKAQERMLSREAAAKAKYQESALRDAVSPLQQRRKEARDRYLALRLEYTITPNALAPSGLYADIDWHLKDFIIYKGNGDISMHYVPFVIVSKRMQELGGWGRSFYFFKCRMNLATAKKEPQYVTFTLRGDEGKANPWTVLNASGEETIKDVEIRHFVRTETVAAERSEVHRDPVQLEGLTLRPLLL